MLSYDSWLNKRRFETKRMLIFCMSREYDGRFLKGAFCTNIHGNYIMLNFVAVAGL